MNVCIDVTDEIVSLPEIVFAPLQPPEAEQLVVLAEAQVSVTDPPPAGRLVELEVNEVIVGTGAVTVNEIELVTQPEPLHAWTAGAYVPGTLKPMDAGVPVYDVALPIG